VGIRPPRTVPEADTAALRSLTAERDRVAASARAARGKRRIPALPADDVSPSRMDSGDPDPDRLSPDTAARSSAQE